MNADRSGHNVPVQTLLADPDPRYRPAGFLLELVGTDGYLDRAIVPLLNALFDRGLASHDCCSSRYLCLWGATKREWDALEAIRQPGMAISACLGGVLSDTKAGGLPALWWDANPRSPEAISPDRLAELRAWSESPDAFLDAAHAILTADLEGPCVEAAPVTWLRSVAAQLREAEQRGKGPGLMIAPAWWAPEEGRHPRLMEVTLGESTCELYVMAENETALFRIQAPTFEELQRATALEMEKVTAQDLGPLRGAEHAAAVSDALSFLEKANRTLARAMPLDTPFTVTGENGEMSTYVARMVRYQVRNPHAPGRIKEAASRCLFRNGTMLYDPREPLAEKNAVLHPFRQTVTFTDESGRQRVRKVPASMDLEKLARYHEERGFQIEDALALGQSPASNPQAVSQREVN